MSDRRSFVRQKGVVLVIALIVLVAMTLAAVAIVRSVDTTNLIAGNLAFQQSARRSAELGVEKAAAWLSDCAVTQISCASTALNQDDPTNGYFAAGALHNPTNWDKFWTSDLPAAGIVKLELGGPSGADSAGNQVYYIIDRLCSGPGAATGGVACVRSNVVNKGKGNDMTDVKIPLNSTSAVYYRITVRVVGPRNTVSYIQAMVAV